MVRRAPSRPLTETCDQLPGISEYLPIISTNSASYRNGGAALAEVENRADGPCGAFVQEDRTAIRMEMPLAGLITLRLTQSVACLDSDTHQICYTKSE